MSANRYTSLLSVLSAPVTDVGGLYPTPAVLRDTYGPSGYTFRIPVIPASIGVSLHSVPDIYQA